MTEQAAGLMEYRSGQRPSVATGLESDAIEDVLFARDELANVAWAVERGVEGAAGGSADRTTTRRREAPPPTGDGGGLRYRLSTTVPAHWLPWCPCAPTQRSRMWCFDAAGC